MPTARLLLTFLLVVSLVSLPSVLSNRFNLPTIPAVKALQETSYGSWYPAGAQEQTLSISVGNGVTGTQIGFLLANEVDAEDWPLSATQYGSGSGNVNCPGSPTVLCSAPVADQGYFEIQFNLAGVLWGIPMKYGNNSAGVELRQAIAHLINKASFVSANAACLGISCVPVDNPMSPCSATSCPNGGLPNPNPCSWDTQYSENSTTNCVVGAPGGLAYNCSYSTSCPTGTVTGTTTFPWQAAIGSSDFCAAAQHFIRAFSDAGIPGATTNTNCELVAPKGGWPSGVTSITSSMSCIGTASTANACFWVRPSEPRKSLGEGLAQDICALFSPAWGGWTTLAGQPVSCDETNTGSSNSACGNGPCPFLQETEGGSQFCGFNTPTNGIPINCWGLGTFGFGQVFPFDSTIYFEYNSLFASKTTVTCTNGTCSSNVPSSTCASTTFSNGASDYMYLCNPTYDSLSSAMEFSPCLSSPGPAADPRINQATPTFAACSGATVSGGAGATTCTGTPPSCSAVSAGYQGADFFGRNVFTLPIYDGNDYYARLSNWPLGGSSPGFSTAVGFGFRGLPNYFNWLNAYGASAAVPGTLRQGLLTSTDSLNPFDATTLWDFYVMGEVYDSLFQPNPLCSISTTFGIAMCSQPYQLMDWMTTSHKFLCYKGGPPCTASTLGYGNLTYFTNTTADLRLTLNRNDHWQDGGPVTAWDVKYSLMNLNATGAFQAYGISNISGVNVLDEYTVDINLKAKGPFTEYYIGSVTMIPGHIWSACGTSAWNAGITGANIVGVNVVNAPEDSCVGKFGAPSVATIGGIRADNPTFSLMANNFFIGSGPYSCESIGGTSHPSVGTLGGGCSVDNTDYPFGLGAFTLTRTGCTLGSSATTCGAAGSSGDYFRSSGALASYFWTGDIGSGSSDFSTILTVNSCHAATPSANCPHWEQGIGNPGGTGSNPVGLSQRLRVNSLRGVSWINFATPQSNGSQSILTCAAGYTLPGTTLTPCSSSNAGWTASVMPGIGGFASTLYEVGSQITIGTITAITNTLSPASSVGCATTYPNGGYDC